MFLAFWAWLKAYKNNLLAVFSFSVSYWLVYYAAELKPYSMDLLVVGIFCLLLGYKRGLIFFLPLLLFFSYAAIFVFWIPAYNLFMLWRKDKSTLPSLITYILVSMAAFISAYSIDWRFGLSQSCLFDYWRDYFICSDSPYCFIKSFTEGLRNMVAWPFGNNRLSLRLASVFIPFFLLGIFLSFRSFLKEAKSGIKTLESFGAIIFIELFILGLFKKYPFTGERVTLFFMPVVFFMIVKGIELFKRYKTLYFSLLTVYTLFLSYSGFNSLLAFLRLYR
ncbi:MAG: hypothetical protein FJZ08_05565 [Candidatus Omnitrophica bacterium]|nr:hypothetical protein [Candidatus Omnitrophota bacterium]